MGSTSWPRPATTACSLGSTLLYHTGPGTRVAITPLHRLSADAVGSGLGLAVARSIIEQHGGRAVHILIAEDAPDVAEVVAFSARLTWPDARVTTAGDGAEALAVFAAQSADLVILDVNMPPPDGYAVCQQIRERSDVPILMLTVRDSIVDKMRGFDLGVDDYLTKPFDYLELMARMRALVRRATTLPATADALAADIITLDETTRTVIVHGLPVTLTSTESRLLSFLMQHAGTVLPHQRILEEVWGESYRHDTHYLKVFVRRLRQKLGDDAAQPRYIQTEWSVGYRFVGPQEQA